MVSYVHHHKLSSIYTEKRKKSGELSHFPKVAQPAEGGAVVLTTMLRSELL